MRKILLTLLFFITINIGIWASGTTAKSIASGDQYYGAFAEAKTNLSTNNWVSTSGSPGNSSTSYTAPSGWLDAGSGKPGYGVMNVQSGKTVIFTVTNITGVSILGASNSSERTINLSVKDNSTSTEVGTIATMSTSSNSTFNVLTYGSTLLASKSYTVTISASTTDNAKFAQIKFVGASSCASAPTITVAPLSATYCVGNTATALGYTSATATAQKWQVSTDNSEWNDISPAQTGTTYTPSTASAGITYYRVIATCDNYTHSATSSAATITIKANHSVTAATSTGTNTYGTVAAASATVCEGSTTTVTATPASGYQVTNWAVSDDDNGASISPTGASSSTSTTLTMGTANATVTVTFGCKAPTSPSVSGTTAYTEGDNISLTASATGISASVTYTWYKGATWDAASATSSIHSGATLSINDCVEGDAGTYWCNISNGTGCDVQTSKTITVSGACTDPGLTITLN